MDLRSIVLAGGTGSRLMPLTKVTNKHLLPVGWKPMIYYPIEVLTSIRIQETLILTGVAHMGDLVSLLGSGNSFVVDSPIKFRMRLAELHRPRDWLRNSPRESL